ncbi:MAG: phasin family protein [Pseudomonadota bacterium]
MAQNPLNLLSRSAAAVVKAGLETLAGAERQGSSLLYAIIGNGEANGNGSARRDDDMPETALGQLESFFDQRVTRVLHTLQIPTSDDIRELTQRVESLTAQVAQLKAAQAEAPAPRRPQKKSAPRKKRATSATAKA